MVVIHRRHRARPTVRRRSNYRSDRLESVGPLDEKTRGSASQIAERYRQLAQDSSSSDRSLSQDYLQHAEHYTRQSAPIGGANGGPDDILSAPQPNSKAPRHSSNRRSNDPASFRQPEIEDIDSDNMNHEDENSQGMQSILPPTIPSTENRWSSVRAPYSRRRRRYQPSSEND